MNVTLLALICALAALCLMQGLAVQGFALLRGQDITGPTNAAVSIDSKDKAPLFRTGDVVNLRSNYYDTTCNVGDKDDEDDDLPSGLRCKGQGSEGFNDGFLVLSQNFAAYQVFDGDSIYLRSLSNNKFCKVGSKKDDHIIICEDGQFGKDSAFVVKAGRKEGTFYLVPASDPDRTCYVEPHGCSHFVRCDRHLPKHHTELLEAKSSGYPHGGGDWPSGGGDWPSGGQA